MSHVPGTDCGGIRNLDRLKDRCFVCADTGCWHWRLSISQGSPRVNIVHPITGKLVKMRGRRAALILRDGAELPTGHTAFPVGECKSLDCVNPEHARSGTRKAEGRALAMSGRVKNLPTKIMASRNTSEKRRKLTVEQVRAIRDGARTDAAWSQELGVSRFAIWSARHGHSHKHVPVVASSVFEWRG